MIEKWLPSFPNSEIRSEGHPGDAQSCVTHGKPVGRAPTVEVRNSHAAYVFTW